MSRKIIKQLVDANAFSSLSGMGRQRQEVMITVGWSCFGAGDGQVEHVQRGRVTADLGLDAIPDPHFTSDEMQRIAFAAKREAHRCLRDRRPRRAKTKTKT